MLDLRREEQALYVPVGDGTRLAVDVWLPTERIAAGDRIGVVIRSTRYYRAEVTEPREGIDVGRAEGEMFTKAGIALVVVDARGTGASFGSRTGELSEREIADLDDIIYWVASWPCSNGRVGVYGTSYEGQAAELVARHRNPHLAAVAALFSPNDPYRQLFYPGGVATSGRFARWMCESQVKDGVLGARKRLGEVMGLPAESIAPPPPVKPVDGPDGRALLVEAIADHQRNTDMQDVLDQVPFRDDRVDGLDWALTAPSDSYEAIAATDVPLFARVGWVDGGFVAGALARFAHLSNHQTVEIGPWGHGGRTHADPLKPTGALDEDDFASPDEQNRRLMEFFARHLANDPEPGPSGCGSLTYSTLGTNQWSTVNAWPPKALDVRRFYPDAEGKLNAREGFPERVFHTVDAASSTGATNRWLAGELGQGASYPDRQRADEKRLTFTSASLASDLHILGFPVVNLRLATNGTDGAAYVYLEQVAPTGAVTYLTEGCLRFIHRATTGPADPGSGVPRSFARVHELPVAPGSEMEVFVELLPVSALIRSGHRIRIAIGGHDASCFSRHGLQDEAYTLAVGESTYLDLPVAAAPSDDARPGGQANWDARCA